MPKIIYQFQFSYYHLQKIKKKLKRQLLFPVQPTKLIQQKQK